MSRRWLAPMLLVLAVNAVALVGVARNRVGEADAVVVLTERELRLESSGRENSGSRLRLQIGRSHFKVEREELEELGFDCSLPLDSEEARRSYRRRLPRDAYVVLEMDGPAWKSWIAERRKEIEDLLERTSDAAELQSIRRRLEVDEVHGSRLVPVDVGSEPAPLRELYPDRERYLVIPTVVKIGIHNEKADSGGGRVDKLRGTFRDLSRRPIHLGRGHRWLRGLEPSAFWPWNDPDTGVPRYFIELAVGRRHEPWVVAAGPLAERAEAAAGRQALIEGGRH